MATQAYATWGGTLTPTLARPVWGGTLTLILTLTGMRSVGWKSELDDEAGAGGGAGGAQQLLPEERALRRSEQLVRESHTIEGLLVVHGGDGSFLLVVLNDMTVHIMESGVGSL